MNRILIRVRATRSIENNNIYLKILQIHTIHFHVHRFNAFQNEKSLRHPYLLIASGGFVKNFSNLLSDTRENSGFGRIVSDFIRMFESSSL